MSARNPSSLCDILGQLVMGVSVANSKPDLYDAVAKHLPLLIPADRVSIALATADDTELEVIALEGLADTLQQGVRLPCNSRTLVGDCWQRQIPQMATISENSPYQDLVVLAKQGLMVAMSAPLITSTRRLGTLNIATTCADLYGESELELLAQVSAMVSATIERLDSIYHSQVTMERHRRYAERLEILNEMGRRLSTAKTEESTFHTVAEAIEHVLEAERVSYVVPNPGGQSCQIFALTGNDVIPKAHSFPLEGSGIAAVLAADRPMAFPDLAAAAYREHAMLVSQGLRMGWSVPIHMNGSTVGILNAATKITWPFPEDALTLLSALGGFMETTLERISAQREVETTLQQMEYRAFHDSLTDLPNRYWLDRTLRSDLQQHSVDHTRLAVLFVDLDGFKEVNDSLSHSIGDRLLCAVAQRLQEQLPADGAIARMGGDEFIVILRNVQSNDDVSDVGQQLLNALAPPFFIQDQPIQVRGSLGMSLFPDHGETPDELLKHADLAMYAAKAGGRNRVQMYSRPMSERLQERIELEQSLQQAIARDELFLMFQPQIEMATGQICALEALVRWRHPERGLLSPGLFIPIAEEIGQIGDITAWVLNRSLQTLAALRSHHPDLYVSVNISAQDLLEPLRLQQHIQSALEQYQLPGTALELELTESVFFQHASTVEGTIDRWRQQGIRLAIDDFGTGFSSLNYLLCLTIDTLKIDRAFVTSIQDNQRTQGVVETIVSLGNTLHMTCVAEGVEETSQLMKLKELGCCKVQGYLLSKPMMADQLLEFLARNSSEGLNSLLAMHSVSSSGKPL
ncbi:MAG: EAL domain-containing protein [Cyanobacteria bacterium P01_A01_bin.3]